MGRRKLRKKAGAVAPAFLMHSIFIAPSGALRQENRPRLKKESS